MPAKPLGGSDDIDLALTRVGELLAAGNESYAIVVVGGAALNLLGIVARTTRDVDVIAFAERAAEGRVELVRAPDPLPAPLAAAIQTVGRDMGLDASWLNPGPASQIGFGFPPGMESRIHWRKYGPLHVGIVARRDLICFKLHAAADNTVASAHGRDLRALAPNDEELEWAAEWVRGQDVGPEFPAQVERVVSYVRSKRQTRQR